MRSVAPLLLLSGLAGSAGAQTAAPVPSPTAWLVVDSAARTASLELEVTRSEPSALIAGHREGGVQVVVPVGWTVRWTWRSADSTAPHSLVLMAEREKMPTEGGRAVFANAETRMLLKGLPAGQPDSTAFVADQAGWYWLLCGVPGHALAGEWIEFKVDPDAATAGVKTK